MQCIYAHINTCVDTTLRQIIYACVHDHTGCTQVAACVDDIATINELTHNCITHTSDPSVYSHIAT